MTELADRSGTAMRDHERVEVEREPYNAEAPLEVLSRPRTPPGLFYVRNHFPVPEIDPDRWTLEVSGAVERPLTLSLSDLREMPSGTVTVTLECAGNGRRFMAPRPPGAPWGFGAVSTAEFTGVPLVAVLERAGVEDAALEVLCSGADRGPVAGGQTVAFERSLPLEEALGPEPLLAWAMAGEPLPAEHGHPLRLVVPGWYAMASVKWLTRLLLVEEPFRGYFQRERYVYRGEEGTPDGSPVTRMRPRAVIAWPSDGAVLPPGRVEVRGTAWSGRGGVRGVEVSVDGGASWSEAVLSAAASRHAATVWRLGWDAEPGAWEIVARATDATGDSQPLESRSNRLGYGNNVAQRVQVRVD